MGDELVVNLLYPAGASLGVFLNRRRQPGLAHHQVDGLWLQMLNPLRPPA